MEFADEIVRSVRQIVRAVGIHSRTLWKSWGITTPQLQTLQEVAQADGLSAGDLARNVGVSQATITRLVDKLESRGLIKRLRDPSDRRRVMISATARGRDLLSRVPRPLHAILTERLNALSEDDQLRLLLAIQELSALLGAEDIDAAPILTPGSELDVEGHG